jgi:tyrosyl-tRNA synthetase
MTLSEELTWRGFTYQTTYRDLGILNGEPITFYWGVDPSSDSMQVGNLAAAMMVKTFARHGHKPVLLIGGATGLIGDPDGKNEERQLKSLDEITDNKAVIVSQYKQIFGEHSFELVDNYDWFKDLGYLQFLRDVGKHVPMRQMLARDFIQSRLSEEGNGISYAEFSYVLIQAYDFYYLHKNYAVSLQVCGSDQWGNSIAGVELIRRLTGEEANVYSVPLLVDSSTGRKFGKTESGAVWLDPAKTSPTKFYQFWINISDDDVEGYLKIFTELDKDEIEKLMGQHNQDRQKRLAQSKLAEQVTLLIHGPEAMQLAKSVTEYLIGSKPLSDIDDNALAAIRREIPNVKTGGQGSIIEALVKSGLASSNTAARQLLSGQAVSLNNQRVNREQFEAGDFLNGRLLMRRGKAFKDSALIELE